jgi:diguanylate cyclase (GGDEF)-like protein
LRRPCIFERLRGEENPVAVSAESNQWGADRTDRRRAVLVGLIFVTFAIAVTPVATTPLPVSYPLFAMLLAASIVSSVITALLLALQARALDAPAIGILATGFAYAAATMLPYGLLYPGMFPPLSAAQGNNGLLWFFWQAGLLTSILAFQWVRSLPHDSARARPLAGRIMAGFAVAYVVLTGLAVWLSSWPGTLSPAMWMSVYTWGTRPAIAALAIGAIAATVRRRVAPTVLDLWLALVGVAMLVDVYLTIVGQMRFSAGWYASRVQMLFVTACVLGVLLSQASRVYATLIERAEELEGEAHTDILTGLPNRRRFDEEFSRAFGSTVRRASQLSLAMIDIDHFKMYNDTFGHQAGDDVLHTIARAIGDSVARSGDFAARYGGEEFVVILEDTSLDGAVSVSERIRKAVLECAIAAPDGGVLSISIGVASRRVGEIPEELIGQADAALYEAKDGGRNRVVAFSEPAATRSTA